MENLISKVKKDRIDSICTKYHIKNYSINPDGSIDVDGNVKLYNKKLVKLPVKFNKVSGDFHCNGNRLTSLVGSPSIVGGNFLCNSNNLTNLIGAPNTVGDNFTSSHNRLTSLKGSPTAVGGNFACHLNSIVTTYSSDTDIEVGGEIYISNNNLLQLLQDNIAHIKLILKYQRHFEIWDTDLSLNIANFTELIEEIKDGLE